MTKDPPNFRSEPLPRHDRKPGLGGRVCGAQEDLKRCHALHGEPPRDIAVNISAAQIWYTDVVQEVAHVLEETGLPPSCCAWN
jgi:hypothetical protein